MCGLPYQELVTHISSFYPRVFSISGGSFIVLNTPGPTVKFATLTCNWIIQLRKVQFREIIMTHPMLLLNAGALLEDASKISDLIYIKAKISGA